MILAHFNLPDVPEERILTEIGCEDFRVLDHESYEEVLGQWLLSRAGMLPAFYSPASHINPKIGDGMLATDFIRSNYHEIARHDFLVFKNLLVETKCPQLMRLHFTTDQYPMEQTIARRLDVSGHAILLVSYDEEGFIFNDPWNKERWGGIRGGKDIKIGHGELIKGRSIPVNCSLSFTGVFSQLDPYFEHLPVATRPNRDVELELVVKWPGIREVHCRRWEIDEISLNLVSFGTLKFASSRNKFKVSLSPGGESRVIIPMNTGSELGSSEINFDVSVRVVSPKFPWVKDNESTRDVLRLNTKYRVSVQSEEFFHLYGMLD
jgi:hypothetical protein